MMPINRHSPSYLWLSVLAILSISLVSIQQINAQDPGDPVTYTQGGIVYQGVIDPDYDTVSVVQVGAAPTTAADPAVAAPPAAAATTTTARNNIGGGLGVGAGAPTTSLQSLQVISGYTPPPSLDLGPPTVSAGSIAALSEISGYTQLLASQQSGSGALPQFVNPIYSSIMGGAFTLAAIVGAVGTLLL